jgi:hypothetical protein
MHNSLPWRSGSSHATPAGIRSNVPTAPVNDKAHGREPETLERQAGRRPVNARALITAAAVTGPQGWNAIESCVRELPANTIVKIVLSHWRSERMNLLLAAP